MREASREAMGKEQGRVGLEANDGKDIEDIRDGRGCERRFHHSRSSHYSHFRKTRDRISCAEAASPQSSCDEF